MQTTITNRARLYEKLTALAGEAIVSLVDEAVSSAADDEVEQIKSNAPEDSGGLKDSVKKYKVTPMRYRISAGGRGTIKDGYDYSLAVEFGNHHSPANPFFFRTHRRNKKRVRNKIRKAVRASLGQVAR